jgi:hypothetical protein
MCSVKCRTILLTGCVLLQLGKCCSADERLVGDLSSPDRWEIRGTTVTAAALRLGLAIDLEVAAAARPRSPLQRLLDVIQLRLAERFRYAGYPDVTVDVSCDESSQQVIIDVTEGPRYRAGSIQVLGTDADAVAEIKRRLTTECVHDQSGFPKLDGKGRVIGWTDREGEEIEPEKPIWFEGEPARFRLADQDQIHTIVCQVLADAGYEEPIVTVRLDRTDTVANLVIQVDELGPITEIAEVHIDGNLVNSESEILKLLDLTLPARLTAELRLRIHRALWGCGRFMNYRIQIQPVDSSQMLHIHVAEVPGAPSLSSPLSPLAESLLRLRSQLMGEDGLQTDWVIESEHGPYRWTEVHSNQGLLIECKQPQGRLENTVILSPQSIAAYDSTAAKKIAFQVQSCLTIHCLLRMDGVDVQEPFRVVLGVSIADPTEPHQSCVRMNLTCDPSYFVGTAYDHRTSAVDGGDELRVTIPYGELRLEKATGKLIEIRVTDENSQPFAIIRGVPNEFERRCHELERRASAFADCHDEQRPISSIVDFVLHSSWMQMCIDSAELTENKRDQIHQGVRLVQLLIEHDRFAPLDDWATSQRDSDDDRDEPLTEVRIPSPEPKELHEEAAIVGLMFSDALLTRNEWPWLLSRELSLALIGQGELYGGTVMDILSSEDCGPVPHWLIAEMLNRAPGGHDAAVAVARRGLLYLEFEDFQRDWAAVVRKWSPAMQQIAQLLGKLSEDELDALSQVLDDDGGIIRRIAKHAAADTVDQPEELLQPLVDHLWHRYWFRPVAKRLYMITRAENDESENP